MPLKLAGVNACRVFELLGLFVNCPSTLEKNFWEIGSQLPKYFEGAFALPTSATETLDFMFKNCGPSSRAFLCGPEAGDRWAQ